MKNTKRWLCIGLSAALTLSVVACSPQGNNDDNNEIPPETILYSDFESWAPDFSTIRVQDYAGAIHINKDKAYAKDNQSLLIHPVGQYRGGGVGKFIFPMSSELYDFDYSNFTMVEKISFEFFNAEEKVTKVALGLVPTISSIDTHTATEAIWYDLAPNVWTTVEYEINSQSLSFLYDVTQIAGFYMMFENINSRDEADAPDVYCDNITIHNLSYIPPKNEGIVLDGMDFMDFEDPLELNTIEHSGALAYRPTVSIVKASDILIGSSTLAAPSGEHVLSIEWVPALDQTPGAGWAQFLIVPKVTENSILNGLTADEAKNLVLCMDVYNANDKELSFGFDFYQNSDRYLASFDVRPGEWRTIRHNMADVLEKFPDFATEGALRFLMTYYDDSNYKDGYHGNKVFYVDNLRFEWASSVIGN